MAEARHHSFLRRHWTDTLFAAAALFVSAVSLWVGIRTEQANEELVAASTWPFEQVEVSNADPDAKLDLQFQVTNAGVGPAKIESFELFWKGKPYRSGIQLLRECCGYRLVKATAPDQQRTMCLWQRGRCRGSSSGRAKSRTFIRYPLGNDNLAVWNALDKAREQMQLSHLLLLGAERVLARRTALGTVPRRVTSIPQR